MAGLGASGRVLVGGQASLQASDVSESADGTNTSNPVDPPPLVTTNKYRDGQPLLFQTIRNAREPARTISGSPDATPQARSNEAFTQTGITYGLNSSSIEQRVGATSIYVDQCVGWKWTSTGGDVLYLPTTGIYTTYLRNTGPINVTTMHPWHQSAPAILTGAQLATINVTEMLQFIQTNNRWNAMLLQRVSGTARQVNTRFAPATVTNPLAPVYTGTPPTLTINYLDGTNATLSAITVSPSVSGGTVPSSANPVLTTLPVFIEFAKPDRAITSASLQFKVEAIASGSTIMGVWPLDPPRNTNLVETGVAYAQNYDASFATEGSLIGYQTHPDGTLSTQYIDVSLPVNVTDQEQFWDPALWGGTEDLTKYPHTMQNKWFTGKSNYFTQSDMDVIPSTYTGAGFTPLIPGHGAMRCRKHVNPLMTGDGDIITSKITDDGSFNLQALMYLPADLWGLEHMFFRYYTYLGNPANETIADAKNIYNGGDGNTWTNNGGKTGIMPYTASTYGSGVGGGSGGGGGQQLRQSWGTVLGNDTGPDTGGITLGLHTFDWVSHCPPGYSMGGPDQGQTGYDAWRFGQIGGKGGVLYNRKWYCVEFEIQLNTVRDEDGNPIGPLGTSTDALTDVTSNRGLGGFLPDGYMKMWLDGVLVWQRQNIVFRTLPMWYGFTAASASVPVSYPGGTFTDGWNATNYFNATDPGYIATNIRPTRDNGLKAFMLNWYHGGQTPNPIEREVFYTQFAYGTSYIGPMKTPTTAIPAWLAAAGNPLNTWVPVPNSKMSTEMVDFSIQYTQGLSTLSTITSYNVGNVFVTDTGYPLNPPTLG